MEDYVFSKVPIDVPKIETLFRRILTPIPAPGSIRILDKLSLYEPASLHHQLPIVWDRANGFQVFDADGNCWIDFTSGIFVANVGHSHFKIRQAISKQLDHQLLHNYVFPSEIRSRLAQKLVEMSPTSLEKVFFLSTGSEATEAALKIMRLYGLQASPKKNVIVGFDGSFHGRTLGAQMMSGKPAGKKWIVNFDRDIHQIPFPFCQQCPWGRTEYEQCGKWCFDNGLDQLEKQDVDLNQVAGFMVESYQGWGAVFYPSDYIKALRTWADNYGSLVTFDEIQSGFGRTGKFFAYEHYSVEADLVCCAKGISGSLPISAVLGRAPLLDMPSDLSSTHTGNPLCCAAALSNLEVIEEERLIEAAKMKGEILLSNLISLQKQYSDILKSVLGKGLVYAVHVINRSTSTLDAYLVDRIIEKAMQKGLLLIRTGCGTIKIGPPLTISAEAIIEGVAVLEEAIGECLD